MNVKESMQMKNRRLSIGRIGNWANKGRGKRVSSGILKWESEEQMGERMVDERMREWWEEDRSGIVNVPIGQGNGQ
jgi:hypothetical protein